MPNGEAARFLGWRVVAAAFVLAAFGWGLGFYGPPIYLHAVREERGWPLSLISAAITTHFLVGAAIVSQLPVIHGRLGVVATTRFAGLAVALGVVGWAWAQQPWQMFAASVVSGVGWAGTSAAAVNAILSPWFVRGRPKALALAYNGASLGGILFQPLWVIGILHLGFAVTALMIAAATAAAIWSLAGLWFSRTPETAGQRPDGDAPGAPASVVTSAWVVSLPGVALGGNWQFRTLIAGTALSLFAQTGVLMHLFVHLVPALGPRSAAWLMTAATIAAMAGRTVTGLLLRPRTDRRIAVSAAVALQLVSSLVLLSAQGSHVSLLIAGVLLFGLGLGNAVSLPPLIAQVEFAREDVPRVVALTVAISQATYAFAPAGFAVFIEWGSGAHGAAAPYLFAGASVIQLVAIAIYLAGRRRV